MTPPTRAIVLAAGRSLQLDGVAKVLIRHPANGRTILDHMIEAFRGKALTVVVGFRAIDVMQAYPGLDYVINPNWALTNNAMSAGLALTEEPTYVVPGDIFFGSELIERLDLEVPDMALTRMAENRIPSSIHCVVDDAQNIQDVYQGPVRSANHPETSGLFKISSVEALRAWKRRCVQHANLFAGQLIPHMTVPIKAVDTGRDEICEINTPVDYLNLIAQSRGAR